MYFVTLWFFQECGFLFSASFMAFYDWMPAGTIKPFEKERLDHPSKTISFLGKTTSFFDGFWVPGVVEPLKKVKPKHLKNIMMELHYHRKTPGALEALSQTRLSIKHGQRHYRNTTVTAKTTKKPLKNGPQKNIQVQNLVFVPKKQVIQRFYQCHR